MKSINKTININNFKKKLNLIYVILSCKTLEFHTFTTCLDSKHHLLHKITIKYYKIPRDKLI